MDDTWDSEHQTHPNPQFSHYASWNQGDPSGLYPSHVPPIFRHSISAPSHPHSFDPPPNQAFPSSFTQPDVFSPGPSAHSSPACNTSLVTSSIQPSTMSQYYPPYDPRFASNISLIENRPLIFTTVPISTMDGETNTGLEHLLFNGVANSRLVVDDTPAGSSCNLYNRPPPFLPQPLEEAPAPSPFIYGRELQPNSWEDDPSSFATFNTTVRNSETLRRSYESHKNTNERRGAHMLHSHVYTSKRRQGDALNTDQTPQSSTKNNSLDPYSPAITKPIVASPNVELANHSRRTRQPRFFCTVPRCNGTFTTKYAWKRHLRSHTGG